MPGLVLPAAKPIGHKTVKVLLLLLGKCVIIMLCNRELLEFF